MSRPAIAIFGAGLIGKRHIAEAAGQARLAAIVDPAPAAAALAAEHDVPHFARPEDCLDALRPDGVVIATPNALHTEQALLCLALGIPVLIEKPLADTVEGAARITRASEESGTPVLTGHHRRYNPIIEAAKALIDRGTLGEVVAVSGQFWLYKPADYFDSAWRSQPGGGPIMINCIHDIDLMRHLVGDVAELRAMRSNKQRGQAVEDSAALIMRFDNGALGTFSVSDTVVSPWSWELTSGENPIYPQLATSCYRIGGTKAALSIPDLTLWAHDGAPSWWAPMSSKAHAVQPGDAFARQFAHFLEVIDGAAPRVSAAEGRASLETTLKCLED